MLTAIGACVYVLQQTAAFHRHWQYLTTNFETTSPLSAFRSVLMRKFPSRALPIDGISRQRDSMSRLRN
jgi:hypothetical protein